MMPDRSRAPVSRLHALGFGLLALGSLAIAGCHVSRGPEKFEPEVFAWQGALEAPATVHLRSINGGIEVKPATDGTLRVSASARWRRGNPHTDLKFLVQSHGTDVTICVMWTDGTCSASQYSMTGDIWDRFVRKRKGTDANVHLTVFVPARVRVDAVTVNGDVTVAATAPVKARTINGSVLVGTAVGPVDAETMNGNADARMTTFGDASGVRVKSMNGDAVAFVPADFAGAVDISASNGGMTSEFTVTHTTPLRRGGRLRGTVGPTGSGARLVEVATMNGSASLRRLNADGTIGPASAISAGAAPVAAASGNRP